MKTSSKPFRISATRQMLAQQLMKREKSMKICGVWKWRHLCPSIPPNSSNLSLLGHRGKEKHGAIKTNKGKLEGKKREICRPTTVVNPTLFPAVARVVIFLLVDQVITSRTM